MKIVFVYILLYIYKNLSVVYCSHGLLLLYRPRDISRECAFSRRLRYDLSYGMGMSDTITLVLRAMDEIDYECSVEIVAATDNVYLLVVINYPDSIAKNCAVNKDAFTVLKKNKCLRLCDLTGTRVTDSPYFVISVRGRIRFRFISNSSINTDINANLYQVTATAARTAPRTGCMNANETVCINEGVSYCFTNFVVCDGIKNCGVSDWFDERKSECSLDAEQLGYAPVIAVLAVAVCVTVAGGHLLLRCLPPLSTSFFIFNANEDNRLRIDPIFKVDETRTDDIEKMKRVSLIPVFSSSSSSSGFDNDELEEKKQYPERQQSVSTNHFQLQTVPVTRTMKSMTERLEKKFRDATRIGRPQATQNTISRVTTD